MPAKKKPARAKTKGSDPFPDFIAPCLATLTREPPAGAQWVHEIKFDGYRMQAHINRGEVRLYTRSGLDWTGRFGHLVKALAALKVDSALVDGEVVVEDANGASNFVMLVEALKSRTSSSMLYFAFDVLFLNGRDLRGLPLLERKSLLQGLLAKAPAKGSIRYSDHIAGDGARMLGAVCKLGLEGIISKRTDKPYRSGRGEDWLKSKCLQSDEFVIGGYVDSTAMREAIGALLLGYFDGGTFHYAGRVGTGFSHAVAHELWKKVQKLRIEKQPFSEALTGVQRKDCVWVSPKLVAQIDYRAITADNLLRHASFKSLREDKPAKEVKLPRFAK